MTYEEASQALQDHMEQHHGVCLSASQWDAAIAVLRQHLIPRAAGDDGELVERLLKIADASRREDGSLIPLGEDLTQAADRITALRAEVERLRFAAAPFVSHVGKSGEKVVLSIGKDTWTGTLKTEHFERLRDVVGERNPAYQEWKRRQALGAKP